MSVFPHQKTTVRITRSFRFLTIDSQDYLEIYGFSLFSFPFGYMSLSKETKKQKKKRRGKKPSIIKATLSN